MSFAMVQRSSIDMDMLREYAGKETESTPKSPGKSSRGEARTDDVMMHRWLHEAPGDEPFSSVSYHAKNDKERQ